MKQLTSRVMQTGWESVLEQVMPPETHPDLVKTYKRFFMAGAQRLLNAFLYQVGFDETMEASENDLSKIDAIRHEINEYFTEVAAGRQ